MCLALFMPSALNAKPRTLQQKMQAEDAGSHSSFQQGTVVEDDEG